MLFFFFFLSSLVRQQGTTCVWRLALHLVRSSLANIFVLLYHDKQQGQTEEKKKYLILAVNLYSDRSLSIFYRFTSIKTRLGVWRTQEKSVVNPTPSARDLQSFLLVHSVRGIYFNSSSTTVLKRVSCEVQSSLKITWPKDWCRLKPS